MVVPVEEKKTKKKSPDAGDTSKKKSPKSKTSSSKKTDSKKLIKKAPAKGKAVTRKKSVPAKVKSAPKTKNAPKKSTPVKENKNTEIEEIDPDALSRGDNPMTVVDHLDEFRSRILIVLGILIVLTFVNFYFSEHIVNYINKPFLSTGNKLNIFKLSGGFIIRLKASIGIAILITFPLIIFHIWRYIAPAIEKQARMFSRITIIFSVLLFYGGVSFVFFLLLPLMIDVLLSFIPSEMLSTIGADDYLSFIFLLSLAMGIIFELPIIILVLTRLGIISPAFLISKRKVALVIIWVFAAIITPPDPLSQSLVAIPLMFLYELSIFISRFVVIRRKKRDLAG
jgi:sec-independent protein translocase protein TatC